MRQITPYFVLPKLNGMKKVRFLQATVWLVFAVLLAFIVVVPFYKGYIKDSSGSNESNTKPEINMSLLPGAVLDARSIDNMRSIDNTRSIDNFKDEEMRINDNYQLENISIHADIKVNTQSIKTPWWLSIYDLLIAIVMFLLLLRLSVILTAIIFNIYSYSIFNKGTVSQFRQIGLLLIIYSGVDYISQQEIFLKSKYLINSPLTIINTSSYDSVLFLCSLLVFIVAEAFKQGAQLQEQQELTI